VSCKQREPCRPLSPGWGRCRLVAFTALTGVACGLLVGAVGLSLLVGPSAGLRRPPAVRIVAAAAATLLLGAGAIAFWEHCSQALSNGQGLWRGVSNGLLSRPVRLALMAALAAVPWGKLGSREPRTDVVFLMPSLAGAGLAFLLAPDVGSTLPDAVLADASVAAVLRAAAVLACSAISTRALAGSLAAISSPDETALQASASRLSYFLLTTVVGGTGLAALLLRGSPWGIAADEGALAAAWAAWTAVWFGGELSPRLREGLSAVASGLVALAALL
jgi:hypothetical protein